MQLEPNELRYGNYVLHNDAIDTICEIGQSYNGYTEKQGYFNFGKYSIEPIPLTEQWLINFGFDKSWDSTFFNLVLPNKYKVYISISLELESYQLCQSVQGFSIDIKFVHDLQNLYYSLTKQELILKQ